jgi:hypothetical protein
MQHTEITIPEPSGVSRFLSFFGHDTEEMQYIKLLRHYQQVNLEHSRIAEQNGILKAGLKALAPNDPTLQVRYVIPNQEARNDNPSQPSTYALQLLTTLMDDTELLKLENLQLREAMTNVSIDNLQDVIVEAPTPQTPSDFLDKMSAFFTDKEKEKEQRRNMKSIQLVRENKSLLGGNAALKSLLQLLNPEHPMLNLHMSLKVTESSSSSAMGSVQSKSNAESNYLKNDNRKIIFLKLKIERLNSK